MNYPKRITGAVILLAVIFISSCSGGGKPKSDGKKYDLSFASLKGPSFTNSIDMDMKMETSAMGMKINMDMKLNGTMRFDMLPDTAGMKQMRMTYEDMSMSMDVPAMKQMMKGADMNSMLGKLTSAFKGSSITILVDSTGEIKDVVGQDEFREHISHSMDSILGEDVMQKAQMQKSMEKFYDKDQLQSMVGNMFTMYNSQPVEIGSSWTRKTNSEVNDMKTNIETKYTLVGVKDGIAEIETDGQLSGGGSGASEGMQTEADMKGTQKGTIKIKLSNGQMVNGDLKMDMSGEVKAGGMKMPMKVKAVYTIKGK